MNLKRSGLGNRENGESLIDFHICACPILDKERPYRYKLQDALKKRGADGVSCAGINGEYR